MQAETVGEGEHLLRGVAEGRTGRRVLGIGVGDDGVEAVVAAVQGDEHERPLAAVVGGRRAVVAAAWVHGCSAATVAATAPPAATPAAGQKLASAEVSGHGDSLARQLRTYSGADRARVTRAAGSAATWPRAAGRRLPPPVDGEEVGQGRGPPGDRHLGQRVEGRAGADLGPELQPEGGADRGQPVLVLGPATDVRRIEEVLGHESGGGGQRRRRPPCPGPGRGRIGTRRGAGAQPEGTGGTHDVLDRLLHQSGAGRRPGERRMQEDGPQQVGDVQILAVAGDQLADNGVGGADRVGQVAPQLGDDRSGGMPGPWSRCERGRRRRSPRSGRAPSSVRSRGGGPAA